MESQYNYEQEIDLKDLMFAVLRKWRPIILIAIVFAVLMWELIIRSCPVWRIRIPIQLPALCRHICP